MVEIFVAEAASPKSANAILRLLSEHFTVGAVSQKEYRREKGEPLQLLFFPTAPNRINAAGAILIVPEGASHLPLLHPSMTVLLCGERGIPIAHSGQVISIGWRGRDTVSISSIGAEKAVASVLRPLTCSDGESIGPMEFTVTVPKGDQLLDVLAAEVVMQLICPR